MGSRDVADDFFGAIPVVLPGGLGLAVAIVAWANWGPRAGRPQPPEEPAAVLAASVRRVVRTRTSRTSRLGRVVRLLPLDARTSLAGVHWRSPEEGERWAPVARALSSPLILVLALSAYERRDPAELLDRRRFPGVDEVTWRVLENADPTANFELWRDDDRRGRRSEDRRHWPEVVTRVLGSADDALLLWWRMAATHAPRWLVPGVRLPLIVLTVPAVRAAGPDGPAFGVLVGCALAQLFTVLSEDGAPRQVGGWAAERRGRRRRVRWALGGAAGVAAASKAIALSRTGRSPGAPVAVLGDAGLVPVDRLTTARAKLAAEPDAAWAAVNRYRRETPHMVEPPERT
ncbi:hypothetical protein [Streptomyces sp. NBC_00310]|uniref:hypothetical protein n=1 Tax=Streptomyces sp. NBC_00310 TaxID=2903645 RepID=UPI002E24F4AD